jgi:transcriptional regulator with XRE-family HTH domain
MAKRVTEADAEIGKRIRARREGLSLSLKQLSEALGVSYQQVQKYENGANRVAGARLQDLASALQTSVANLIGADEQANAGDLPSLSAKGRRLIASFERLPLEVQRSILDLTEGLATKHGI